jgi:hypothetical protein
MMNSITLGAFRAARWANNGFGTYMCPPFMYDATRPDAATLAMVRACLADALLKKDGYGRCRARDDATIFVSTTYSAA